MTEILYIVTFLYFPCFLSILGEFVLKNVGALKETLYKCYYEDICKTIVPIIGSDMDYNIS